MKTLAIVATYNEAENIRKLAAEIFRVRPEMNLLIIDDNSPDGTGRIADEMQAEDERITVIHRGGKLGLGSASIEGLKYAIKKDYDFALVMDGDFSHDPKYIPAMIEVSAGADVVVGSRYVPGGGSVNWGATRKAASRLINFFSRFILGIKAHDTSGAFRLYRISKLKDVGLDRILSRGYSFQEEMLLRCQKAGLSITEVPIVFVDRKTGTSKLSLIEIARSMLTLVKLLFLSLLGRI